MSIEVDWGLAARVAGGLAGDDPAGAPPPDLAASATDAAARVEAFTGMRPPGALPEIEWVDRRAWINANLDTLRSTMAPLLERSGAAPQPLRSVAGGLIAVEVGGLLGLFCRRVMGQYEVRLLDPGTSPRLLLVGPNLRMAAGQMGVSHDDLVRWVTVHEVTHAVQFGAVPWLRDHLGGLLRELIAGLTFRPDPRALLRLDLDDLRAVADSVRRGGLVGAVMGPERQATVERLQGTMALVEGHAEHVMDGALVDSLDSVPQLRAALNSRRAGRSPVLRVLDRLLGFELKLRQYESGRRFCDAVADERGEEGLTAAWSQPSTLPSWPEIEDPPAWLARTRPAAA